MRKLILMLACSLLLFVLSHAQLTSLPDGGNKKAMVGERVGLTDITISYNRPGVKGREGKIWGALITPGFNNLGFGPSKAAPWRAGANENTTIQFSNDVRIEGQPLKAGRYGFFIAYDANEPTLIFSKNSDSWGSFYYDPNEDVLRVKVRTVPTDKSVEWLKYEFLNQNENSATIALEWEKLMIPFKVETDYLNDQIESFRRELRTEKSFNWESWNQAAAWSAQHNVNLEQALAWSDTATSQNFGGSNVFQPWSTRALVLEKMGRQSEADAIMKKSLPLANMFEIHQYGRQLLQQKKTKEALEVFKMNYAKNPDQFSTLMGLARGYSANGDYKNALKYANMALAKVPEGQKKFVESLVDKLKNGQDIN
jgi:tetratricopeptide (TPR) repeat protein